MRKRRSHLQRGNAMLEFAIAFPVFWLLFAGVYQFGYSFYIYNVLTTSAANAAELGSNLSYDVANPTAYTTSLQNLVVYGTTTAGSKPVVPNLSTSNVGVTVNPTSGASCNAGSGSTTPCPQVITITINSYTINAIFTNFALNGKPRVTVAYTGQVTCSTC